MGDWATYLTDPNLQKALSWIGGGLAATGAAIWTVTKYFYPQEDKEASETVAQNSDTSSKVFAEGGSTAVGGNLSISEPAIHQGPSNLSVIALAIGGVGIVALALAFAGNQIKADRGSAAVGGDVTGSTITITNQANSTTAPGSETNSNSDISLRALRASRLFASMKDLIMGEYAGVGVVAFPRSPEGSLVERATLLCEAFALSMETVQVEIARGFEPDQLVVTVWPVEPKAEDTRTGERGTSNAEPSSKPVESVLVASSQEELPPDISCEEAIVRYDWREGSDALQQAAVYYRSRGKPHVAEKIGAPDQDGPWLLAWAPGKNKGSSEDDVLVLAYDLSEVQTQRQAERVFQSWRIAIESNTDLWLAPRIANEHWTSAFVRFLNMLGDNTDFYTWMMKG